VLAVTDLVHRALFPMRSRGRGRILLLGSTAAFQPGPFMSVYYATKAYVLSLGRALSEELRGSGITVTTLCPGPTRSEFFDRAGMTEQSPLKRLGLMATAPVARLGVSALLKGRREVVAGRLNLLGSWLGSFLPTALGLRVVAFLQRPPT
jgi:short-subunit dehydrogenase